MKGDLMEGYKKLCAFKPYFQSIKENEAKPRENSNFVVEYTDLFTTYSREMMNFAKIFYEAEIIDYHYNETLAVKTIDTMEAMLEIIPTADEELIRAILTKLIREERFSSGVWIQYMERGLFLATIIRLEELIAESEVIK